VGERHVLTSLLTYAPQVLFVIPTSVLLLIGLGRRDRTGTAINAVALGFCLFALMGLRCCVTAAPRPEGATLRVMTFNVEKWSHGTAAVAAAIRDQDPDVVCLQEAGAYFWLTRPDQTPRALEKILPHYRFVASGEIMIGSRLPLNGSWMATLPGPEARPAVIATLDVRGRRVNVVSIHLLPADYDDAIRQQGRRRFVRNQNAVRMAQVWTLRNMLGGLPGPFVVGGDFNAQPQTRVCRALTEHYVDAFDAVGRGFGYTNPATFPVTRIDHLLLGNGVRARRAFVPNVIASDHRPLVADLEIP
jgi:vancomycin resistance protein VanJ